MLLLLQVSQSASQEDLLLAKDLQDTLQANRVTCVGLAANMIGVQKYVIIFNYWNASHGHDLEGGDYFVKRTK